MKRNIIKMIAGLLAFVLLLSGVPAQIAHASAGEELLEVISYADGSYLEITLETLPQARASGSVAKAKNYVYKNENNIEQWKITLTGSFTYTGTGSTCTASSCNVTIYNSVWSVASKSATKSGNTAYCSARMVKKYLGATILEKPCNFTLTCDKNGNVS